MAQTKPWVNMNSMPVSGVNRIGLLLAPSYLSGLLVLLASAVIIGSAAMSGIQGGEFLSVVTDIFSARTDEITAANGGLDAVQNVLSSSALNSIVYIGFWALVGSMVYLMLQIIAKGLEPFNEMMATYRANKSRKSQTLKIIAAQITLRFIFTIAATVYVFVIKDLIVPFSVAVTRFAVDSGAGVMILNLLVASIVLIIGLHLLTVLLRLAALRLRVFGGEDLSM